MTKLLIATMAAALLSACNSNDAQRTRPVNSATSTAAKPQARAVPGPVVARDGGMGPGIGDATTSGTSSGLNAGPNAPATGTTTPSTTPSNGTGADNGSGSTTPTQR